MNNIDAQYQALLHDIISNGVEKQTRNGKVITTFGRQIRHKMSEGFPLLTTKKMYWKGIVTELLWFLRGDTNIKFLLDYDCHIWDGDAYKNYSSYVVEEWEAGAINELEVEELIVEESNDGKNISYRKLTQEEFINKIKKSDTKFVESEFYDKIKWIADVNDDIYDPTYTDMLRVAFTSEFGRGKLQDLVALLSGRNFETKQYEDVITRELGVSPVRINSSLVSAQNRERLYWTNIPGITIPEDRNIKCTDVIPNGYGAGRRGVERKDGKKSDSKYEIKLTVRTDFKFNCLVTNPSNTNLVYYPDGKIRTITVEEAEVLQTVPKGYTDVPGISKAAKYRMLGNGWTIDVIKHILKPLKSKKKSVYTK